MRRLCLSLLVLAGCASVTVPSAAPAWKLLSASPDVTELQFQTDQNLNRATITASGAQGPFVDLKRTAGKLQGTVRVDTPVELQQKGSEIHGRVAGDAFDLTLIPDEQEIRATGLARGVPSTFWMSPPKVRGSIGECQFDLVWGAGRYSGTRTCGARSEVVSVLVPAALSTWSDPEVAAMLVLISTRQ